jgi:hypothetical protein
MFSAQVQAQAYVQAMDGTAGTTAETMRLLEEKLNQVQDALTGLLTSAAPRATPWA